MLWAYVDTNGIFSFVVGCCGPLCILMVFARMLWASVYTNGIARMLWASVYTNGICSYVVGLCVYQWYLFVCCGPLCIRMVLARMLWAPVYTNGICSYVVGLCVY